MKAGPDIERALELSYRPPGKSQRFADWHDGSAQLQGPIHSPLLDFYRARPSSGQTLRLNPERA